MRTVGVRDRCAKASTTAGTLSTASIVTPYNGTGPAGIAPAGPAACTDAPDTSRAASIKPIRCMAYCTVLASAQVNPSAEMPVMICWKSVKPAVPSPGSSQNGWKKNEAKPSRTTSA